MQIQNVHLDAVDFASQGNAILGIRDSGKSYTATYLAEQLLEADIPFVAFDPIGVWKYLRIGANGHAGYPIVVAGDDGDLPLSAETAPNIVRAAMQENIPLVIDLYSMHLSKAAWKKIVEESVRLLLYENKTHGVRHIFIEEAAEFVPQRVGPGQGMVYAEIEKLARMGRNASLGYTLINQRAEEVNKAVLELCDCLFLHRQKGRHSLTALDKWLSIADTDNVKEIIKSLPQLEQGKCWVWQAGSQSPKLVKIPTKNTVHPDPKNPELARHGISADVSQFVSRMNKSLAKQKVVTVSTPKEKAAAAPDYQVTELLLEVSDLKKELEQVKSELQKSKAESSEAVKRLEAVRELLKPQYDQLQTVFGALGNGHVSSGNVDASKYDVWIAKLTGKQKDMLRVLIDRKRVSQTQMRLLVGMSNSGTYQEYMRQIIALGLAKKDGDDYVLQEIG